MNKIKPIAFKIESSWLQSGYYVYAASIVYKKQTYYYIGQTGDNHYHTARAPLYRVSGHFTKGTSTENQIIKYFKNKILKNAKVSKQDLETAMCNSIIKYTFWKVAAFNYTDNSGHELGRNKSQFIEQWLIFHLQNQKNITILNSKVTNKISSAKKKYFRDKTDSICAIGKQILNGLGYE